MGFLRFFLALSVLFGHAGVHVRLLPGDAAVQTFYVISGFYMALVINTNKSYSNKTFFWTQRALRLFPMYYAILISTIVLFLLSGPGERFTMAYAAVEKNALLFGYYLLSQALIIGQEVFLVIQIDPTGLSFQPHLQHATQLAADLLVVPQAWSLSLELMFYCLAPFIVRRSSQVLISFITLSTMVRLALQFIWGLHGDPWSYRFFPSELALFLTGALGYRLITERKNSPQWRTYLVVVSALMAAIIVNRTEAGGAFRLRPSFPLMWASIAVIPLLFSLTRSNTVDRIIGELSYPLYISHILVLFAFRSGMFGPASPIVVAAVALAFSVLVYVIVDIPVEQFRRRIRKPGQQIVSISAA